MIDRTTLNVLCPLHLVLDRDGKVVQAGPTLVKLRPDLPLVGMRFLEIFHVFRPRAIRDPRSLLAAAGRKLHMKFRDEPKTAIKGLLMPDAHTGGAVVNLSFGIAVTEAVRDYRLTSADFAVTDLAVEMLYLVEAKSAAMEASRLLNQRLQGAKIAAEERAFTDTLTGLRNRRAMDYMMGRMINAAGAFSVMHLDLDFFKDVNDTMGHAAGDHVLQHVAAKMVAMTRKDDIVTRVGGDEFVIILNDLTHRERLSEIAGRIIGEIEKPILYNQKTCRVAASIGIASRQPNSRLSAADILQQADDALYASKNAGRAQFSFYEADSDGTSHERRTFEDRRAVGG